MSSKLEVGDALVAVYVGLNSGLVMGHALKYVDDGPLSARPRHGQIG
jgi:hypothetical protein